MSKIPHPQHLPGKAWNEDMQIGNLPQMVRESFAYNRITKKKYHKGIRLVRIVTTGNNSFTGAFCIRPYFFEKIQLYARWKKIPLDKAIREKLALLSSFSPRPNVAAIITLGEDFYGFEGPVGHQIDPKKNEHLSGGFVQVYIPNLSREHSNKVGFHCRF